jgi:hypothetical protein
MEEFQRHTVQRAATHRAHAEDAPSRDQKRLDVAVQKRQIGRLEVGVPREDSTSSET